MKFLNLFRKGSVARDGLGGGEKRRPVPADAVVWIVKVSNNYDVFPIGSIIHGLPGPIPDEWGKK